MLWFDNDQKTALDAKVNRAANYYQKKYGHAPQLCFIHPDTLGKTKPINAKKKFLSGNVELRVVTWLLPHHYWMGVPEKKEGKTN